MEIKPQIKIKITRTGTGYHCFIPKTLIETKVLKEGEEYLAFIEKAVKLCLGRVAHTYNNIISNYKGVVC